MVDKCNLGWGNVALKVSRSQTKGGEPIQKILVSQERGLSGDGDNSGDCKSCGGTRSFGGAAATVDSDVGTVGAWWWWTPVDGLSSSCWHSRRIQRTPPSPWQQLSWAAVNLVLYLVTDRCSCLIFGAPVVFCAGFERLAGTTPC